MAHEINEHGILNILDYLNYQKVSPVYSVLFCLRLLGKQVNEISKESGVSRVYFYKVLAGQRKPNERIKEKPEELGITPWN